MGRLMMHLTEGEEKSETSSVVIEQLECRVVSLQEEIARSSTLATEKSKIDELRITVLEEENERLQERVLEKSEIAKTLEEIKEHQLDLDDQRAILQRRKDELQLMQSEKMEYERKFATYVQTQDHNLADCRTIMCGISILMERTIALLPEDEKLKSWPTEPSKSAKSETTGVVTDHTASKSTTKGSGGIRTVLPHSISSDDSDEEGSQNSEIRAVDSDEEGSQRSVGTTLNSDEIDERNEALEYLLKHLTEMKQGVKVLHRRSLEHIYSTQQYERDLIESENERTKAEETANKVSTLLCGSLCV